MINRGILLLRCKQPALDWLNDVTAREEGLEKLKLADLNDDRQAYLISDEDAENPERWLKRNYEELFAHELEAWFDDEGAWPHNRTYKMFREWFDYECHSMVIDTVDAPLEDEHAGLSLGSAAHEHRRTGGRGFQPFGSQQRSKRERWWK